MQKAGEPLIQYGRRSDLSVLPWSWVDGQLSAAGCYWLSVRADAPHPRPVWGLWAEDTLYLSIGSPTLAAATTEAGAGVAVHLSSDTDVVILEGRSDGQTSDPTLIAAYNDKYEWDYSVDAYGPLSVIEPLKVMAWRSAGWAGRGGFEATGRWLLDRPQT